MAARTKNDNIGKAGEKRIIELLQKLGAENVVLTASDNRHPDITFKYDKVPHLVECKTLKPIYSCRVSSVHIRRSEINYMASIEDEDIVKGLIVEVRAGKRNKYYMYLDWKVVAQQYAKTQPEVMSLSFHTICEQGMNIKYYFTNLILMKRF